MKKDRSLPNENIQSNNSSVKPLPSSSRNSRPQKPFLNIFPEDEIHKTIQKMI